MNPTDSASETAGRRITVTGPILRITATPVEDAAGKKGTVYLLEMALGEPTPNAYLSFRFDQGDEKELARLKTGELVYTGVRRTPVCAVLAGAC